MYKEFGVDVDPIPPVTLVAALLLVGGAIAAEAGFSAVSRGEMRRLAEEGNGRAKLVDQVLRDPATFWLTMLLVKTAGVLTAGAMVVELALERLSGGQMFAVVAAAWLLLSVLQAAGRSWILGRGAAVALAMAPAVRVTTVLLWPLTAVLRRLAREVGKEQPEDLVDRALLSEDGLRRLMESAQEEEPIPESDKQMIASILEMNETVARELMVPRIDMVALDVDTTLHEALSVINAAGHSRIPVYEDNIDRIVGFLYAKDLLKHFEENRGDAPIRDFLRPAYFVPVSKKVNTLLREMQRDRVHIAMVVDEYGGIAGLITIEDILEEIVGEIQDEYDQEEESDVQVVAPGVYLFNARFDIYSLAKLLDVELPDEDADTLGGLIYSQLGHVPVPGESVEIAGWRFTVLTLEGRRIGQVRAEALNRNEERPVADEQSASSAQEATGNSSVLNYTSASD